MVQLIEIFGVRMNKNILLCIVLMFFQFSCCSINSVNSGVKKDKNVSLYAKKLKKKPCWIVHYRNCPKYRNDNSFFFDAAINYKTPDNLKKIDDYQLKLALSKSYVSSLSSKIVSEHKDYKECISKNDDTIFCTTTSNHTILIDARAYIHISKIEIVERYIDVEEKTYHVLGKVLQHIYQNILKQVSLNPKKKPHPYELHDYNSCQHLDQKHLPKKKDQEVEIIWYQVNKNEN